MNRKSISVVIPVFNEEDYLKACMESLLKDLGENDEVIIVDNNSSDSTADIAANFTNQDKRVRYILEEKQGSMNARQAGFDIAKSDVLATVDADTNVLKGWSKIMLQELRRQEADAISGYGLFKVKYLRGFTSGIANFILFGLLPLFIGTKGFLFGTSYMIKKEVWESIRGETNTSKDVWDDYEVTLLANDAGFKIVHTGEKLYTYSPRRSLDSPVKLWSYGMRGVKTLKRHRSVRAYFLPYLGLITIGLAMLLLRPATVLEAKFKRD